MTTLTLTAPLMISARLLPAIRIGEATLSLDTERMDRFYFDLLPGQTERTIDGFGFARRSDPDELVREAFATFLSFASASNEAVAYGPKSDNYTLFDPDIRDYLRQHSGEIDELSMELDEQ